MPTVKPISDLQRNIREIVALCQESKEPIYLTKNGSASLVVIDAQTYDEEMAIHQEIKDKEIRVQKALLRGYEDSKEGRMRSLEQARKDALAMREADHVR